MATTLYVSPTGSDSNNGSQNAPFRTILAASQAAQAGTTIHVASGTYAGGFTTTSSGTASAPITYVSDTPGGAVIVGSGNNTSNQAGWENRGNNVAISGFTIDGSGSQATGWAFGFYNGGSNVTFQGNTVHDIMTNSGAYASLTSSGNGGAGIMMDSYYGGSNGNVLANTVYNIGPSGTTSTLVHGIYQTESGLVENNLVHNVVGDGLTSWHDAQNISFINNTVNQVGGSGILVGSNGSGTGDHFMVENNIVMNAANGIYEEGTTGTHNVYADNVLYDTSGSQLHLQNGMTASNTIDANPMFVNASGGDFHLQSGSPAIGAGTMSSAPATDIAGAPRQGKDDIGAYQYGSSAATPTPTPTATPTPTPTPTATPTPPTVTPDQLTLVLSEDAYKGNAQFIVKLDGKQIGNPTQVTASHSAGKTQSFSFQGNWAAGSHDLEVDFINDAYAGPGHDRNLYVNQVQYAGTNYLSQTDPLYSNGAIHVAVGH